MAKTLNSLCIIHLHLSQERRKICYLNDFENILYIFYKTCINRVPEESGHFVKAAYVLLTCKGFAVFTMPRRYLKELIYNKTYLYFH